MSNIVKNKYIFSFLGCLFVLLFSSFLSNAFLGHLTLFDANNENNSLGGWIALMYLYPIFFGLGLLLYFFIAKKIFLTFKTAFSLVLSLLGWFLIYIAFANTVLPLLSSLLNR